MYPTNNNHSAFHSPQNSNSSSSTSEDIISIELADTNIISLRPVPKPPSPTLLVHSSSALPLLHVHNDTSSLGSNPRIQLPPSYSINSSSTSLDATTGGLPEIRRPDSIMMELMGMVMTEDVSNDDEGCETSKKKDLHTPPHFKNSAGSGGGGLSGFFRRKLFKESVAGPLNVSFSSELSSPGGMESFSSPGGISNTSPTRQLIPSSPMPSPLNLLDSPNKVNSPTKETIQTRKSNANPKEMKRKLKWDDKIKRMRQEINSYGFQKDKKSSSDTSQNDSNIFEREGNGQSLGDVILNEDNETLIQKPTKHFMSHYFTSKFMKDSKNPFTVNRTVNQEFKKTPFLTISLTIVQIIMFAISVGLGGIESILVNPLIGPPESTLVQLGAKQGTLIISPNWQVYRLLTPIFLHGGIVHLCLNMIWQMSVMLPLERHWGCVFVCFIYLISGIGGNLLSSLFLPEIVTVGASSSLFGILGGIYADLWMNWRYMPSPKRDFLLITIQVIAQIIVGLIPWIDNFAHVGGLLVGFLSTMIFIPLMRHPNPYEEQASSSSNQSKKKRRNLNEDDVGNLEELDLENGSKKSKWNSFKKSKTFHILVSCSAFCCCCFFCCSEKTRRVGKLTWWVRIVSAGLLFSYFAIFGGLYFTQMDWECKWCYFINPDWNTLYEIFEIVKEKIQQ